MIIEVKNTDVYIPNYRNNIKDWKDKKKKIHKELDEKDKIKVHHRFLLPGERKKYVYTEPIVLNISTNEVDPKVKYIQDMPGIVKAIVTGIENLEVKDGEKTVKVDTVEKLYLTSGVSQKLIADIEGKLLNASPEVDDDFLPEPLAST